MYRLDAFNNIIAVRDIKACDLPRILGWYNMVDEFKYATGLDRPITFEGLAERYRKILASPDEFFAGIYLSAGSEIIGMIKGKLKEPGMDAVWISSIAIDPAYRNRGFGKAAINLMLGSLRSEINVSNAYLAVAEENLPGIAFWKSVNFREINRINNHASLSGKKRNVIIMYRKIY